MLCTKSLTLTKLSAKSVRFIGLLPLDVLEL